jgi:hypothetical protein
MNRRHEYSSRFNATGLATGCILALVVAMAVSVFFDIQPVQASTTTKMAHNVHAYA